MNDDLIQKFLNGQASDNEFTYCESLLAAEETVVEEDALSRDSLTSSIRSHDRTFDPNSEESRKLTERIESLIERQAMGREDLERILDPALLPDELGRIGKYRVLEFIASGGMGLVFKAEDTDLLRPVCIKVLHPALGMKSEAKLRFERESRAAAKLRSERIVTLLDVGIQRELPYFVMQLLEGETLRSKLNRMKKLDPASATRYLRQIVEGLRHAHGLGIIHRDIKPDNIWITAEDDIKLLDFGLARAIDESVNLSTSGGILGTPHYMSPEQIQGEPIDARSDLFSVGIVLYEMLTGELPFQKNNIVSTMIAIANDPIDLSSQLSVLALPSQLSSLLTDLLKKSPHERPQSADAVIERLQEASDRSNSSGRPIRVLSQVDDSKGLRKNGTGSKIVLGVAAGIGAALLGMFLYEQQNKGTLVVRTNDPNVEVQIAREKVNVKDPLSGREYEIRIGDTPLPSGVYQLEMNIKEGELSFSSSMIAIRRGQRTIVDVELKPDYAIASSTASIEKKNDDKPSIEMHGEGNDSDSKFNERKSYGEIVDPSYDQTARDNFGARLNMLPAMSLDEFIAIADSKTKLIPGLSVETTALPPSNVEHNSDHSLVAAAVDGFVKIWDASGELKHLIPVQRRVSKILFDNEHPNLLAINVYNLQPHEVHAPVDNPHSIFIWRLQSDRAELIGRFESSSYDMAWDHGYRLAYYQSERFGIFRIDLGKSFDVPGPKEEMLRSFSPDGRTIATIPQSVGGQTSINLWDLHQGSFAFSLLNSSEVTWCSDSDRVAIFPYGKPNCEIWDLKNKMLAQSIDLPAESNQMERGGQMPGNRAAIEFAIDPMFGRLAWLSKGGSLILRNLSNNRQSAIQVPHSEPKNFSGKLRWTSDGAIVIQTKQGTYRWTSQGSEVDGTITESEQPWLQPPADIDRFEFKQAFGSVADAPVLSWSNRSEQYRNGFEVNGQKLNRFDLRSKAILSDVTLETSDRFSVSPRGTHAVVTSINSRVASANGPGMRGSPSNNECFLRSLMESKDSFPTRKLSRPDSVFHWTKEGRYLAVNGQQKGKGIIIIDTESNTDYQDPVEVTLALGLEKEFMTFGRESTSQSKWVCRSLQIDSRTEENGSLASSNLTVKPSPVSIPDLNHFESIDRASLHNESLFVSGHIKDASPANGDSIQMRTIDRIPLENGKPFHRERINVDGSNRILISPSGEFVFHHAFSFSFETRRRDEKVGIFITRWSDDAQGITSQNESEPLKPSAFSNKLIDQVSTNFRNMQWHSDQDVAFWTNYGAPYFYDAKTNQLKSDPNIFTPVQGALATDYGWLLCHENELLFYDHVGNRLGKLGFDSHLTDGKPTNPCWILADGSISIRGSKKDLGVSYFKGSSLFTESFDSFARTHSETPLPMFEVLPFLPSAAER